MVTVGPSRTGEGQTIYGLGPTPGYGFGAGVFGYYNAYNPWIFGGMFRMNPCFGPYANPMIYNPFVPFGCVQYPTVTREQDYIPSSSSYSRGSTPPAKSDPVPSVKPPEEPAKPPQQTPPEPPKPVEKPKPDETPPSLDNLPLPTRRIPPWIIQPVKYEPPLTCSEERNAYYEAIGREDLVKFPPTDSQGRACERCDTKAYLGKMSQISEFAEIVKKGKAQNNLSLSENPIARGAQRLIAGVYGSCEFLNPSNLLCSEDELKGVSPEGELEKAEGRKVQNEKLVLETQPWLKQQCTPDPNVRAHAKCDGVCKKVPIFNFAGKFKYEMSRNGPQKVNINTTDGYNQLKFPEQKYGSGVDCSAFASASVVAAGLRIFPEGSTQKDPFRTDTATFLNMNSRNSCFAPVESSPESAANGDLLKSGDLVVWNGHMVVIESASNDPFGIQKWEKDPSGKPICDPKKNGFIDNLDFKVLNSTSLGGGMGLVRLRAKDFFKKTPDAITSLSEIAKSACERLLNKDASAKKFNGQVSYRGRNVFSILRHSGRERTDCILSDKELEITGMESCAKECLDQLAKERGKK